MPARGEASTYADWEERGCLLALCGDCLCWFSKQKLSIVKAVLNIPKLNIPFLLHSLWCVLSGITKSIESEVGSWNHVCPADGGSIARMESYHISGELFVRAKTQQALGDCLLLYRVVASRARDVTPFGPGWEAVPLLCACYVVVDVFSFCLGKSAKAVPGVQGYFLQETSMLLSLSKILLSLQLLALRSCGV